MGSDRRTRVAKDAPGGLTATGVERGDVWARWWPWLNAGFALLALAAVALSLGRDDLPLGRRLLALPVLAAGTWWYWWRVLHRAAYERRIGPGVVYFAVQIPLFFTLTWLDPVYSLLAFMMFWTTWALLPLAPAAVVAAILGLGMWLQPQLAGGDGVTFSAPALFAALGGLAISTLLAAYVGAIIRQSDERASLLEELGREREARARAERQAGALEERARLGRDIHDTLAQGFTSIVMHLEAADATLPRPVDAPARRHLDQARRTARDSLAEARRLVWALRPPDLDDASLAHALDRLLARWGTRVGIRVALRVDGPASSLHPEVEVTMLRVAQEALTNVEKHARARAVDVTVTYFADQVILDVQDDGVGFEPANGAGAGREGGFGLLGMRERAERLGGSLEIETGAGTGTTVALTLPAIPPPEGTPGDAGSPDAILAERDARPADLVTPERAEGDDGHAAKGDDRRWMANGPVTRSRS